MAAGPWIGVKALKMTFKGLLNERMSLDFQINIKEMKRELRESIKQTNQIMNHTFLNMQQHYIIKFQNKYKKPKLKNTPEDGVIN